MENKLNIEEITRYQELIKEMFDEAVSADVYDKWADTFEIQLSDENQVLIVYRGSLDIKSFKKECRDALFACIGIVMGEGKKIKITQKGKEQIPFSPTPAQSINKSNNIYASFSPETKKNLKAVNFFVIGMIFVCLATAVIVIMCNYIGNRSFRETFYSVSSIKVDSPVRVIQLSDMHGARFGKENQKLLSRVKALNPDLIILTGDIVDSAEEDVDYAVSLGKNLSEIAPSYYIYGNNETETIYDVALTQSELDKKFGFSEGNRDETKLLEIKDTFEEKLEKSGIKVLKNEKDTIKVRTMTVDVYGVLNSNPSSFWSYSENAFGSYINENKENLKITAVHEPFIFETFNPEFWGDLMVAGHTHGGIIRIPVLGPLYTKEGGLFPERNGHFIYGRYDTAGNPLILSAGLENSNILRINNQPELVVIDINKF